mmetsp:Transcript_13/g.29  ORF Transcript_13/g.29 Transcript_13/m.29 type:complete len:172 (-) Transcript_13:473-988(-)
MLDRTHSCLSMIDYPQQKTNKLSTEKNVLKFHTSQTKNEGKTKVYFREPKQDPPLLNYFRHFLGVGLSHVVAKFIADGVGRAPEAARARSQPASPEAGIVQFVLFADGRQYAHDVGFEYHPAHDDLVQHVVHFVGMKDEVQLAHVFEAFVQGLDENLFGIKAAEARGDRNF